ncbi:MAG: GGDEF domain-containing protein [Magnetospirillum sp.]|nr:GGDEF domain-containing protein [Magnetospirillum sp.]
MAKVFDRMGREMGRTIIPVVDKHGQPLGILHERTLKNIAYTAYGRDLVVNKALGRSLRDFMLHCPIAEISTSLDQILAIFSTNDDTEGVIVTEQLCYVGFLSARSIIRAIHEKTLATAREANPLTKLPGNEVINEYLVERLAAGEGSTLAYVDFDNFKPFNDTYGFRQGDRAILLFAELVRRVAGPGWFIGHIGGDDFFIGFQGKSLEDAVGLVTSLIAKFASDARSFYDPDARERGHIVAQDREGKLKEFPLLSASAVLLAIPQGRKAFTADDISAAIAARKKEAKASPSKIAEAALPSAAD